MRSELLWLASLRPTRIGWLRLTHCGDWPAYLIAIRLNDSRLRTDFSAADALLHLEYDLHLGLSTEEMIGRIKNKIGMVGWDSQIQEFLIYPLYFEVIERVKYNDYYWQINGMGHRVIRVFEKLQAAYKAGLKKGAEESQVAG